MKRPTDLLYGAVLLAAALVAFLATGGGASFPVSAGPTASFSDALLLTSAPSLPGPTADTFAALGKLGRVVVGQYEVRDTDTLSSVAKTFGSGPDYLRSTNRLASVNLPPGKTLLVHNGLGMLYQVREKNGRPESLQDIAKRYNLKPESVARANGLSGVSLLSGAWLEAGSVLFLPTVRLRFSDYILPVAWSRGQRMISSGYGMRRHPISRTRRFHQGLDMPRPAGSPVRSAREGRVIFAGWRGAYGRLIILKHANGICTWYGHLSTIDVQAGDKIKQGQFIGRVGSSGQATGPHLHFEVRDRYGNTMNPKKSICFSGDFKL
ncbi:MAG: M23 family metallopeptidase [Elusimicrobia bacterium]|nr:M23 family metallopeptidase [Elusimicrobiota bacterium]